MGNPLRELLDQGQSVWYDNIRRGLLTSGELKKLIEEDGLRGVTSNPTIFEKAIIGSTDYNEALKALVAAGNDVPQIFDALAVEDIQMAADLFRPVFEATEGRDGFVSIEVSPALAQDTQGTIAEARRFFQQVNRPNVLVKVPATPEGIPAIQQLIGEGININITLMFSLEHYEQVANAYLAGLETLARAGKPLDRVASVASFFVSRVDTMVDGLLEAKIRETSDARHRATLEGLLGKAGIANSKLTYRRFQEIFGGPRFQALQKQGARVQRPLWASTSTKNPRYRDVLYVEELIGPDTIDTMPPATLAAFRDHGRARRTLDEDVEGAQAVFRRLGEVGIDFDAVTRKLQEDGVKLFADSFDKLMQGIETKRHVILGGLVPRQIAALGEGEAPVQSALEAVGEEGVVRRLWTKDPSLWRQEPAHQEIIKNALGWLRVGEGMLEHAGDLEAFAAEVRGAGFTHVLLLGMGGSSLCPDVCRITYGVRPGHPDLQVLDSTDPATILAAERAVDLGRTLFIISSKSGTTTESDCLGRYFYEKVRGLKGEAAGASFIAITDPGTPLRELAEDRKFRRCFLNPADIGGRYSALSYFGLVPAALIGVDVRALLDRAERMVHACDACVPVEDNPGVILGTLLGELGKRGRDKVTFILSPPIEAFGTWVEQLIAESTGKEGKGLVPVEGETLGPPAVYGDDRLFVSLRLAGRANDDLDAQLRGLGEAGHPVVCITLQDRLDLGEEFFRWEFATAVAGSLLGINAFDQPNVQESKDNTKRLLQEYKKTGRLPEVAPALTEGGLRLFADEETLNALGRGDGSLTGLLRAHLAQARPGDYVAIMAYAQRAPAYAAILQAIRMRIRDGLKVATTLGYGPRFLHSTGQLHKGGANNGLFLQVTADDAVDLPIPGEPYTFSTLKQAQALGDLQSLERHGRRVLRVHLGADVAAGLRRLQRVIEEAVPTER